MKNKASLYKSVLIALCLSLLVFSIALAASGGLDTTFSSDGKIIQGFGGTNDYGSDIAVQTDGKVVVVGTKSTSTAGDFAIARYTTAGLLDTTFSGDGKLTISFDVNDQAVGAVIQSDGKIVVVGNACNADWLCKVALVRLNPNGTPDTSFGVGGKVTTVVRSGDHGATNVILQGAKIVVAGYAPDLADDRNAAILRYNANGQLDTTFSGDGIFELNVGKYDEFTSVVFTGQKIIAVGRFTPSNSVGVWADFILAQVNLNGTLDTAFGNSGKVITDLGNNEIPEEIALIGGKIVVAGYSGSSGALLQFTSAGKLDSTFSSDGKLKTNLGFSKAWLYGLANQNGKILVSGMVMDGSGATKAVLARFTSTGAPDTTFGGTGVIATSWGGKYDSYDSVIFKNSRIYAVGSTTNASNVGRFIIARYLP
jgi:uncharacterized delta-60 repeat protein